MKTIYQDYPETSDGDKVFMMMAATMALLTSPVKADREQGKANVKAWKYGKGLNNRIALN